MLILKTNQTNKIPVTVSSLTKVQNPKYLFRFFHIQSKENFLVYLTKQNSGSRYDLFSLVLPTVLDLPTGKFKYSIYESEDEVLNFENKRLLETGFAHISKEFPENVFFNAYEVNKINYGE